MDPEAWAPAAEWQESEAVVFPDPAGATRTFDEAAPPAGEESTETAVAEMPDKKADNAA